MFRFIHTSDWHLGQNFYGYDRSEEQRDFLRQLAGIVGEQQPDALLVSGDIFHTAAPSNAAVNLYVNAMLDIHRACPSMAIVVIAGNHDSASRLDSDKRLWQLAGVTVLGGLARDEDGHADLDPHVVKVGDKGIVAAVPFAYPASFPQVVDGDDNRNRRQQAYFQALLDKANADNDASLPVVLMAHLAVSDSIFIGHDRDMKMEFLDLSTLGTGYDYVALGHIHHPQQVNNNPRVRYCGTPLPVSFDEKPEHSVSIVEIDAHGALPRVMTQCINNLKPLHTIPSGDPVAFEQALDELEHRGDVNNAYIRLNVLVEQYLPSGAQERAASAVSEKHGRFCEIKKTSSVVADGPVRQMTLEEFNSKRPIDLANQYFLEKHNREMNEQETEMFNYVYQLVQEEERQ